MSYIGQTKKNFGDRWDNHRSLLRNGRHSNPLLQEAWNIHGEDAFEFKIVEAVDDEATLDELEIKYIASYKECGKCYNLSRGGHESPTLGRSLSEETKAKIGAKNREHMLGRKLSDETKKKMSASQRRRYSEWTDDDRRRHGEISAQYASGYKWSAESKQKFSDLQKTQPNSAKFSKEDIWAIREKHNSGASNVELADEYNTSPAYISSIINRRRWANI